MLRDSSYSHGDIMKRNNIVLGLIGTVIFATGLYVGDRIENAKTEDRIDQVVYCLANHPKCGSTKEERATIMRKA